VSCTAGSESRHQQGKRCLSGTSSVLMRDVRLVEYGASEFGDSGGDLLG
jgi:hypothetical protein